MQPFDDENKNTQPTKPLPAFQREPGLLSRWQHEMDVRKARQMRQDPPTEVLPDFTPAQIQRLADDIARLDVSHGEWRRHRRRRWLRRVVRVLLYAAIAAIVIYLLAALVWLLFIVR